MTPSDASAEQREEASDIARILMQSFGIYQTCYSAEISGRQLLDAIKHLQAAGYAKRPAAASATEVTEAWHCPHCGSTKDPWFDRCLDEHGNMADRCQECGGDVSAKGEFAAMADELAKRIESERRLRYEVTMLRRFASKGACDNVDKALAAASEGKTTP